MNAKKVKALRKQIGYHPSEPRAYARFRGGIINHPATKRSQYQQLKRGN